MNEATEATRINRNRYEKIPEYAKKVTTRKSWSLRAEYLNNEYRNNVDEEEKDHKDGFTKIVRGRGEGKMKSSPRCIWNTLSESTQEKAVEKDKISNRALKTNSDPKQHH